LQIRSLLDPGDKRKGEKGRGSSKQGEKKLSTTSNVAPSLKKREGKKHTWGDRGRGSLLARGSCYTLAGGRKGEGERTAWRGTKK